MIHQLNMQARKSHRKQQNPDELIDFVTKKPRKSKKPIIAQNQWIMFTVEELRYRLPCVIHKEYAIPQRMGIIAVILVVLLLRQQVNH